MKTWTKTASAMLLSVALLAACGDDEEEATGEDVPDTEEDTTEAEDVDATEEEDESEDGKGSDDYFADDQQLSLGETGTYDANFGTFEITPNDVWAEDDFEGEASESDFFLFIDITVENISEESHDGLDLISSELMNEGESYVSPYWDYGFEGEEVEPGESLTGEIIYNVNESSYYELVYGHGPDSLSNEVRWAFDADELEE